MASESTSSSLLTEKLEQLSMKTAEATSSVVFPENLGNEFVTIYVGPKNEEFKVHKTLLCKSADFFKGAFRPEFKEGREGVMYMPEDEPGVFALFVQYIYRSKIPAGNTETHLHNLYDFYQFADKLCLTGLKDKIMDSIQDMAMRYDLKDQLITDDLVKKAMNMKSPTNVRLKSFTICALVSVFPQNWREDPCTGDDTIDTDGNQEIEAKDDDDEPAGPPYQYVKKADKKAIWELCKNDFDFLYAFDTQLEQELQDRTNDIYDPRVRDEKIPHDRYWFHCHKVGFDCRADQTREAELKFIPKASHRN